MFSLLDIYISQDPGPPDESAACFGSDGMTDEERRLKTKRLAVRLQPEDARGDPAR